MRCFVAAGLALASACPALADDIELQSLDGSVRFSGSYGLTSIRASEFVWEGKTKVSQLIWRSRYMSTFNGALTVELPRDWYLNARATIGLGGDGHHMVDYDWLIPDRPWSDRSLHPDTRLNHYFAGGVELGKTVLSLDGTDLGLGAGFKYTDVKWTAWGGSYIYSTFGFRNDRGDLDPREKSISLRQQWPVPYLGVNLTHRDGNWTLASSLQGGFALHARDTDDHWSRSLRFYDYMDTTPAVSLSGSVEYRVRGATSLFLSGSLDKMFRTRADTKAIDLSTGKTEHDPDSAGGSFLSTTMSFGVKGTF